MDEQDHNNSGDKEWRIKSNEPLAPYCTYRIGGPAQCIFFAADKHEVIAGLEVARDSKIPFFVLGGGSNILFSDSGFGGLVLKMENNGIKLGWEGQTAVLEVGAGTPLSALVNFALQNSLTGMEWAAGIPGTVGGAIRGNAGAFHEEMSERVRQVQCVEMGSNNLSEKDFPKSDCAFSYRESMFKHNSNLIIVSATLLLAKGRQENIRSAMSEYLAKKSTTQPLEYPSAGSVFMNPQGFFAGKVIEDCGFKGKQIGGAKVSEKHSNFIVNTGGATANDVKELIRQIKAAAKEKFGIDLKEEIEIVGK